MAPWTIPVTDQYEVLVLDPPWMYSRPPDVAPGKINLGAVDHYGLMTQQELHDMPVQDWMAKRAAVFLWTTGPKLGDAFDCLNAWGLHYRGMAFVWVKTTKDGRVKGAQGPRPVSVKSNAEFVLCAARNRKGSPLPVQDLTIRQIVMQAPGAHSAKPEYVQDMLERMYPEASKAEFFARRWRAGWDCFGDELQNEKAPPF